MAADAFRIVGSLQAAVFRVEGVVAEDGSAVVYRAHHEAFKAPVALKCPKIPGAFTAEQRQAFLQKFQGEGEVLFRLSTLTPNVVRPLHVGTLEHTAEPLVPFIALEWLEGESLAALLARRRAANEPPLDLARVARLLGPVARALECAHRFAGPDGATLSILHRDLQPKNLFVCQVHGQEALKLLNFAIAETLGSFAPTYGAPEQWLPKRYGQAGPWTDVWGFALCAVEALTQRVPFEGDAPAVMSACLDERRRPTPLALGVQLPTRAEAAFQRALAVDPAARFQDIGEFWDEVEGAAGVFTPRLGAGDVVPDVLPAPQPELALPSLLPPSAPRVPRRPAPTPSLELDELEDDGVRISIMRGGSLDQLDAAPPAPKPRTELPELAAPVRGVGDSRMSEAPSVVSLLTRLKPGLWLVGAGALLMVADIAYTAITGQPFTVGPARALWLAGPLVGFGVVKLVVSLSG